MSRSARGAGSRGRVMLSALVMSDFGRVLLLGVFAVAVVLHASRKLQLWTPSYVDVAPSPVPRGGLGTGVAMMGRVVAAFLPASHQLRRRIMMLRSATTVAAVYASVLAGSHGSGGRSGAVTARACVWRAKHRSTVIAINLLVRCIVWSAVIGLLIEARAPVRRSVSPCCGSSSRRALSRVKGRVVVGRGGEGLQSLVFIILGRVRLRVEAMERLY